MPETNAIPYTPAGQFGFSKDPKHLESVQQYRDAMVADGWDMEPRYKTEPVDRAGRLTRAGWVCSILTRCPLEMNGQPHPKWHNESEVDIWGPDRLAVRVPAHYSWEALQAAVRTCHECGAKDVDTERVGFAGRCCATCLPAARKRIEYPGWCD
jgi:hypothetical protein